jgi:branched-chain amino acid transport system permease protein
MNKKKIPFPLVRFSLLAIFFALIIILPLIIRDQYYQHLMILTGLAITISLSLNLVMTTGQLSIAHAAFMGIGAYSSTLLVLRIGLSFWLALPISGIVAGAVGMLIGFPTLKMRGVYFAIATFAFGELVRMVFTNWVSLFGGANGIRDIPSPNPIPFITGDLHFETRGTFCYLVFLLMVLSIFINYRLLHSRIGIAFHAIEEVEALAEQSGIPVMKYKLLAFLISSIFTGLAGSLYAHYSQYIAPGFFTFWESVNFIIMVIIGGVGTIGGPIFGAVFLTLVPEMLRATKEYEMIIYALTLIIVVLFLPKGLMSILRLPKFDQEKIRK